MKKICVLAAVVSAAVVSESHAADLGVGFYGAVRGGATESETMNFAQ